MIIVFKIIKIGDSKASKIYWNTLKSETNVITAVIYKKLISAKWCFIKNNDLFL